MLMCSSNTAKTAVIGMSKNVALEFAAGNIRVNVVCPGPTPTALNTPEQGEYTNRAYPRLDTLYSLLYIHLLVI